MKFTLSQEGHLISKAFQLNNFKKTERDFQKPGNQTRSTNGRKNNSELNNKKTRKKKRRN